MKKWTVILLWLSPFLVGGALGYLVAIRRVFLTREDYIRLLHMSLENRAAVCFQFLKAQESGSAEDLVALQRRSLTNLNFYVTEVQWLQEQGFAWAPFDQQLYTNAKAYMADHPLRK
jgi:hypothetical protein